MSLNCAFCNRKFFPTPLEALTCCNACSAFVSTARVPKDPATPRVPPHPAGRDALPDPLAKTPSKFHKRVDVSVEFIRPEEVKAQPVQSKSNTKTQKNASFNSVTMRFLADSSNALCTAFETAITPKPEKTTFVSHSYSGLPIFEPMPAKTTPAYFCVDPVMGPEKSATVQYQNGKAKEQKIVRSQVATHPRSVFPSNLHQNPKMTLLSPKNARVSKTNSAIFSPKESPDMFLSKVHSADNSVLEGESLTLPDVSFPPSITESEQEEREHNVNHCFQDMGVIFRHPKPSEEMRLSNQAVFHNTFENLKAGFVKNRA